MKWIENERMVWIRHTGRHMCKISVIIPCHNVEDYIKECLESVFSQTLRGIEVICIDDGSTDRTLDVIEKYLMKAENLKVLKQENRGAGSARNRGIDIASGEFIAFMDADDFYPSENTLEKIYHTAREEGAEICGGSVCVYRNGVYTYTKLRKGYVFEKDGWIEKENFPTMGAYWRLIYKKNFIKKHSIYFPDYLRYQDPPFLLQAIASAGRVYCIKDVTYVYRKEHKQVVYTQRKAVDCAKGVRDSLYISKKENMLNIYCQIARELQGTLSALMYLHAEKSGEMRDIIHQINEVIYDDVGRATGIQFLKEGEEISKYIREAKRDIQLFLDKLHNEKRILIFGAGTVGKAVRAYLDEQGIKIEAFVVSDPGQNAMLLDGMQVRCIDEYRDKKDECMVIVATFPYLHEEIKNTLRNKEFERVYILPLEKLHLFIGEVKH